MNSRFVLSFTVLVFLIAGTVFVSMHSKKPVEEVVKNASLALKTVRVVSASELKTHVEEIATTGIVTTEAEATIVAQTSGTITSVRAAVGKNVGVGQVLFMIDNTASSLPPEDGFRSPELQSADLSWSSAKEAYRQAKRVDDKIETHATKTAKKQAKNARDAAEIAYIAQRDRLVVKSPIAGTVMAYDVRVGDTVSVGTKLATIGRGKKLVRFFVSAQGKTALAVGRAVSLSSPLLTKDVVAHIVKMSDVVERGSQRFLVEAAIDPSVSELFSSGVLVDVRFPKTTVAPEGHIFLPLEAVLQPRAGEFAVFVYNGGVVQQKTVTVVSIAGAIAKVAGIGSDEQVVLTHVKRLKDGERVELDRG